MGHKSLIIGLVAATQLVVASTSNRRHTTPGFKFANICTSTPLYSELECEPHEAPPTPGSGSHIYNVNSTEPSDLPPYTPPVSTWTGGKRCVKQYCLWANRGFANGRGIVVITDSANLEKVKTMETRMAQEESTTAQASDIQPPYEVKETSGKGLGLIASSSMKRGETVMRQMPVLLAHRTFIDQLSPDEKYPLLDFVPSLLPAETRRTFQGQMGHFGSSNKVSDILATNSFQMDVGGSDGHHYGNFPEVSRFNHDCRPNVVFHMGGRDLAHKTTVVRDIRPGEELTISYLDQMGPRTTRRARAHKAWGFECQCSQCGVSDEEAEASDNRLTEIRDLEQRLSSFKWDVSLDMVERLVKLYKQERLESKIAGAYTTAALNCNLLGKEKMAVEYAKLSIEAGEMEKGPEGADVKAMQELMREPKSHFTWRGRMKNKS